MSTGELIAFSALGVGIVGLIIHALKQAVDYGALRQRVQHLEDAALDNKDIAKLVIQMAEKLDGFGIRLNEVASGVTWLTTVPPETPGRSIQAPTRRSRAKVKP